MHHQCTSAAYRDIYASRRQPKGHLLATDSLPHTAGMQRVPFDLKAYAERTTKGPCFICGLVAGEPAFAHHVVYEDDETVIFLSKYPTMAGYCLVSPKAHHEDLAEDLTLAQYLALQTHVHRLARALKLLFDAERIYVLSLGSRQGNSHLHFHVAPLPRGVPYQHQQYQALMAENGIVSMTDTELAALARQIGAAYVALGDADRGEV